MALSRPCQSRRPCSETISNGGSSSRVHRRPVWASAAFCPGQALGEQAPPGQPDPGVNERHRQLVGQPLQVVGHVQAVFAARVDEMKVIDDPDPGLARQHAVHRLAGQLGGAGPAGAGMAVELADHPVQRAQRGVGGQPGPEHRDPLVALAGQRPVAADLVAVEAAGEAVRGGRLAQARAARRSPPRRAPGPDRTARPPRSAPARRARRPAAGSARSRSWRASRGGPRRTPPGPRRPAVSAAPADSCPGRSRAGAST